MKALSSIKSSQHYIINNRSSQRSTNKVLQRIKHVARKTHILHKNHIIHALEKEHITHTSHQLCVLEEIVQILKLQEDEDDYLFNHKKNSYIIKKIENSIIDIMAKQNYTSEPISTLTEANEYNINCTGMFLKQNASNCFTVSALHLILQYYKNIDLEKYIDHHENEIVVKFADSSYSPSRNIVQKLALEGYKVILNSSGKLYKVLITPEKLQNINSSKQNISIVYHRKKTVSEAQELSFKSLLNIAIHLHGRISIITQKMVDIADKDDASMCAYDDERGNPLYATKLFGFDAQYEVPLVNFIKHHEYLSKYLNDDGILLIVNMYYNSKNHKKNEPVGHCWSLLNYNNSTQVFELYNPHGQREIYTYLEILHYCPTISIFSNKKLNIELLKPKLFDDDCEDISYDYKKHIYFSKDHSGEKVYYYKENDIYHRISGIYKCFDTTRIFDHGVIIGNNITFIKKYLDEEYKLYQVFQNQNGGVIEILFNGIYQDHFYKTGAIVKNLRTKYVLHPNTDANGKVISSDPVKYCRYF